MLVLDDFPFKFDTEEPLKGGNEYFDRMNDYYVKMKVIKLLKQKMPELDFNKMQEVLEIPENRRI